MKQYNVTSKIPQNSRFNQVRINDKIHLAMNNINQHNNELYDDYIDDSTNNIKKYVREYNYDSDLEQSIDNQSNESYQSGDLNSTSNKSTKSNNNYSNGKFYSMYKQTNSKPTSKNDNYLRDFNNELLHKSKSNLKQNDLKQNNLKQNTLKQNNSQNSNSYEIIEAIDSNLCEKIRKSYAEILNISLLNVPEVGKAKNNICMYALDFGLPCLNINGFESRSPLSNYAFGSSELSKNSENHQEYLNLFKIMIPDIPNWKNGGKSRSQMYVEFLDKEGLKASVAHFHWWGTEPFMTSVCTQNIGIHPIEFAKKIARSLKLIDIIYYNNLLS